jgi:HAD superfamily phosphoserine phosphatase-like hydrolase
VIAFHQHRAYRYTRDLVKNLKKRGYYLLAISQSPMELVQRFAKKLGFDKMYGRVYEVSPRKIFTGRINYLNLIVDKAKVLRRVIEKENLTLRGSVGVGDTEGDISFLNLVDKPICFNPNQKLYKHARKKGWNVIVERKDMIYSL